MMSRFPARSSPGWWLEDQTSKRSEKSDWAIQMPSGPNQTLLISTNPKSMQEENAFLAEICSVSCFTEFLFHDSVMEINLWPAMVDKHFLVNVSRYKPSAISTQYAKSGIEGQLMAESALHSEYLYLRFFSGSYPFNSPILLLRRIETYFELYQSTLALPTAWA